MSKTEGDCWEELRVARSQLAHQKRELSDRDATICEMGAEMADLQETIRNGEDAIRALDRQVTMLIDQRKEG